MFTYARAAVIDEVRNAVFVGSLTSGQVSGMEQLLDGWEWLQPMGDRLRLRRAVRGASSR